MNLLPKDSLQIVSWLCLSIVLLTACTHISNKAITAGAAVPHPVTTQTARIRGENRQYLTLDIGDAPKDTVIFYFTGSGCHDITYLLNPLYGRLNLNARLIALPKKAVTPTSTGTSCSDAFVDYDNLDNLVEDAAVLIQLTLNAQRYKNVVLAGHSEGGDIIWRLLEKIPAVTHVFSMHRGLGMNNLDELHVIARNKMPAQRIIYRQLIADLEGNSQYYADDDFILIRKKRSWQIAVKDRRNPADVMLRSGKKVLIMMGDKDQHVPVRSMYAANKVFCDNRSKQLLAIVKKGYGHRMDVNTPERAMELDMLARWIRGEALELSEPFQRLACA